MTFHGTGTYLLGDREVVVIDPGPALPEHEDCLCRALVDRRPEIILVTHRHQDHAGLARSLARRLDIPVAAFGNLRRSPSTPLGSESEQAGFVPDRTLRDREHLDTVAGTLEVLHTPGHTGDHLCFVDHGHRRVFCGDHVMAWSTSVIIPPDGHVGRYLESLERLRRFSNYTFWPTHGPPITDAGEWLDALIEHRRSRQRQIVAALTQGPATSEELLSRIYGALSPVLRSAARQSLLAGLAYLVELGQAAAPDAADGLYRVRGKPSAGCRGGKS